MKAFCFGNGLVGVGQSVPTGAIQLASHDDECELLIVLRWNTKMISDETGCPAMFILEAVQSHNQTAAVVRVCEVRSKILRELAMLRKDPGTKSFFMPRPLEAWSEKAFVMSERYA